MTTNPVCGTTVEEDSAAGRTFSREVSCYFFRCTACPARHYKDSYFWRNASVLGIQRLRFMADSSVNGPKQGKPMLVGAGMRCDCISVVFAHPEEINQLIKQACQ